MANRTGLRRWLWQLLRWKNSYIKVKTDDSSSSSIAQGLSASASSTLAKSNVVSRMRRLCRCCVRPAVRPPKTSQGFINYVTIVIFLEFFAWGLVTTILPEAIKEFFGADRMWVVLGIAQGIKGILSFLSAPLLGALSDSRGRKPFLILTVACTCLPLPFLLLSNLWWHVIIVAFSGAFAVTFSIVFAYVSDVTLPEDRSAAYGQVSATFAASLVISPALGSILTGSFGKWAVYLVSTIVAVVDVLFLVLFVPESKGFVPHREQDSGLIGDVSDRAESPSEADHQPRPSSRPQFNWNDVNPLSSLKIVFSSYIMLQLGGMVFASYLPEAGQYQCMMLYLQNTIGFNKAQLAAYIAVLGVMSIVMQTFVLSWVSHRMSQKSVIITALAAQAAQLVIYGLFTQKWVMFAVGIGVSYSSIAYPAMSALVSQTATSDQQGAVQGMVTGIRSLCTGLGPALFGVLFQMVEVNISDEEVSDESGEVHVAHRQTSFPGAPFLVGAGFVLVALFITLGLPEKLPSMSSQSQSRTRDVNGSFSEARDKESIPGLASLDIADDIMSVGTATLPTDFGAEFELSARPGASSDTSLPVLQETSFGPKTSRSNSVSERPSELRL